MDKKERKEILAELADETRTLILYEAPHRLVRTLEELLQALGNRRITLCRELTKRYENAFSTTIEDLLAFYQTDKPLGECVLVIEGKSREEIRAQEIASFEEMTIEEHMERYESQGMSNKDAMKQVAKDRGVSKRDIYQYFLNQKK
jgi:16S rRNA (cytidine1402-2'-O)-methyltransferase